MERKNYELLLASIAAAATGWLLLDALILEKHYFEIKKFDIGDPDKHKSKIKILFVTDLHLQKELTKTYKKLARKINGINPDLLFFGGDSVDQWGTEEALEDFLKLLRHKIQKVAILGNHERAANLDISLLKEIYKKYNADLLINKSKAYLIKNKRIMVTGLDDIVFGCPNFKKAVKKVGKEENHFVLIHSPYQQEDTKLVLEKINSQRAEGEKLNISYFFAGHNHGGQVNLFGFAPVLPRKSGTFVEGWYNEEKPYLYLSKGFGTSSLPVRFGARAEITLFRYAIS